MKTIRSIALLSAVLMLFFALPVSAEPTSGITDGAYAALLEDAAAPGTALSAGGTLTLRLSVSGEAILGVQGGLQYDPQKLTPVEIRSEADGWSAFLSEQKDSFLVCSDTMSKPLDGKAIACSMIFRVADGVGFGETLTVTVTNCAFTDGTRQIKVGDPTFEKKVSPLDSKAARLDNITVDGYTTEPAFDPEIFTYTVKGVPASAQSVSVTATPKSEDLVLTQYGDTPLHGGKNREYIAVEAPDGSVAIYTVFVVRDFGDDYTPSADNALTAIHLSEGVLSPAFDPEKTDYIIYLPHEWAEKPFTVSGDARDEKAQTIENVTAVLIPGSNTLTLSCLAENGEKRDYRLTVIVLPEYTGVAPYINGTTALTGHLTLTEQAGTPDENGDPTKELRLDFYPDRADATYTVEWFVGRSKEECDGTVFALDDGLAGKTVRALVKGSGSFTGELDIRYTVPEKPAPSLTLTIELKTILIAVGILLVLILLGFIIGLPVGKASVRRFEESGDEADDTLDIIIGDEPLDENPSPDPDAK